ncbi:hypothetical protein HQN60_12750 [Deefgea piscis]|uniref:Carrier domain-containing protein n=1 Tax=Deefgea piscis TaxID=2739061 RepID=A0A6M8SQM6_9NEIS|nr:hypothetical protein [Deefgea piscis]QKJ67505.1 hypothetical protein HQN60_12750 [Deefgea piscis]
MKAMLLVVFVVVLLFFWVGAETSRRNKQIEKAFSGRESLTIEQFYSRYFQDKGIPFSIVAGVVKTLEEQLNADMSRIRPDDDFSKILEFFWAYDDMADVAIVVEFEKLFDIVISNDEAESTHTIADIVNLIHFKREAR